MRRHRKLFLVNLRDKLINEKYFFLKFFLEFVIHGRAMGKTVSFKLKRIIRSIIKNDFILKCDVDSHQSFPLKNLLDTACLPMCYC